MSSGATQTYADKVPRRAPALQGSDQAARPGVIQARPLRGTALLARSHALMAAPARLSGAASRARIARALQQSLGNGRLAVTIQRNKVNEKPLAGIQGLAMGDLLPALQALADDVRTDEEAGGNVGGSRLVTAMHAVRYKDQGKTWSQFVDAYRPELVGLKQEDQIGDVLAFLGAKKRHIAAFLAQNVRPIAARWQGVKTGPNTKEVRVGAKGQVVDDKTAGIRRIPLQIDSRHQAIVLIPTRLNPAAAIEVFLHLHGHRLKGDEIGYRGETLDSVRDIRKDQTEQQMLASGRDQMIAVLPQGSAVSQFPGVDTTDYLANVFAALNYLGVWGLDKAGKPIEVKTGGHQVILSAHSGGGALLSSLVQEGGKPARPGGVEELVLFDAINTRSFPKKKKDGSIETDDQGKPVPSGVPDVAASGELKRVRAFVAYQLDLELQQLDGLAKLANGKPDPNRDQVRQRQLQFLQASGFRLRGYYTPGWYEQIYAPLVNDIDDWFKTTAAAKLPGLDAKVIERWSKNYVIQAINAISTVGPVGKTGHQGHEYILGQGKPAGKGGRDYDPAKGGALQDALSALP